VVLWSSFCSNQTENCFRSSPYYLYIPLFVLALVFFSILSRDHCRCFPLLRAGQSVWRLQFVSPNAVGFFPPGLVALILKSCLGFRFPASGVRHAQGRPPFFILLLSCHGAAEWSSLLDFLRRGPLVTRASPPGDSWDPSKFVLEILFLRTFTGMVKINVDYLRAFSFPRLLRVSSSFTVTVSEPLFP